MLFKSFNRYFTQTVGFYRIVFNDIILNLFIFSERKYFSVILFKAQKTLKNKSGSIL